MHHTSRIPFQTIFIYGVGLLGGSIGLRIKEMDPSCSVLGVTRSHASKVIALQRKAVDRICDDGTAAAVDADFLIFCVSPTMVFPFLKKIFSSLKHNAIVTDISSVKGDVYKDIARYVKTQNARLHKHVRYIGSHPMAGSEKKGVAHADPTMLEHAMVFLTPFKNTAHRDVKQLEQFWHALGCRTCVISPTEHDRYVAITSHLPYILADTLASYGYALWKKQPNVQNAIARSFKDMTRIAVSDPDLWTDITLCNKKNLVSAIQAFRQTLKTIETALKQGDAKKIHTVFSNAQNARNVLVQGST